MSSNFYNENINCDFMKIHTKKYLFDSNKQFLDNYEKFLFKRILI